jgi:hypothetical protein
VSATRLVHLTAECVFLRFKRAASCRFQKFRMPNCPKCGHFFTDFEWQLQQRGVQPHLATAAGERCRECGCLKANAPTPRQRERGVNIDPWGQIVGFDGQSMRLNRESMKQHADSVASCEVTIAFHQTSARAARSIMSSQKFQAGTKGCVGAGMYFATSPEATYPKTTASGVILAVEVRLGRRLQVTACVFLRPFVMQYTRFRCLSPIPRTARGGATRRVRHRWPSSRSAAAGAAPPTPPARNVVVLNKIPCVLAYSCRARHCLQLPSTCTLTLQQFSRSAALVRPRIRRVRAQPNRPHTRAQLLPRWRLLAT